MGEGITIYSLVVGAGPVVQFVLLLLLVVSVLSWAFIFDKWRELKEARGEADKFESKFWSGANLFELYDDYEKRTDNFGIGEIFVAGFAEFKRRREDAAFTDTVLSEGVSRVMKVSISRNAEQLETRLTFLATVGSVSPYVGLFGTVWGIMHAFIALSDVRQATLALVAPGIAEALVATAMGLVAAIPAVVAYNRYCETTERLIARYGNFAEEFFAILSGQAKHAGQAKQVKEAGQAKQTLTRQPSEA